MKKISLLVFASCALLTACVEHDKCYEVAEPTTECACHKAPACGCQKKHACGCQKNASCGCAAASMVQPVMPVMQPKTVVVVVPAKPQPQRHILEPEIVYPEPRSCGCKRR
jgi:hypothetical protein